jgi:hypothetical protein
MLPMGNRPELCRFNNTVVIPNAIKPKVAGLANFVSLKIFFLPWSEYLLRNVL